MVRFGPGAISQATDAIEILKKRLGSKSPNIQLLSLSALEALSKNCGENVFQEIVDRGILHDMVEIVREKSDLNVREKILILLDTWQEAFGGREGRYPQCHSAYNELKSSGVEFPPREKNSVPLYTPPQTHPIATYGRFDPEASHQTDPLGLSLSEITTAQGIAVLLMDMLNELDPNNITGVEEELIAELVDQCCNFQNYLMALIDSTSNEVLLGKALASNDTLIHALSRHAEIVESRDDYGQLAPRSSRDSPHAHNKNGPHEPVHVIPTPPRPPLATNSKCEDSSRVDEDFWNYMGSSSNGLDGETRDLSLPPVKKEKAEDICN
ncbi:target of Myb protein 1 [Tanacetum coccineum]